MTYGDAKDFARRQLLKAQFDFMIGAMKDAAKRTIKLLELCRDNPNCTCDPNGVVEIGFCPSCKSLQEKSLKAGDIITEMCEITDGSDIFRPDEETDRAEAEELSGAPDNPEPFGQREASGSFTVSHDEWPDNIE